MFLQTNRKTFLGKVFALCALWTKEGLGADLGPEATSSQARRLRMDERMESRIQGLPVLCPNALCSDQQVVSKTEPHFLFKANSIHCQLEIQLLARNFRKSNID